MAASDTLYSGTDVKVVGGPELKFNQVWSATHQRIQLQVTSYLAVPTVDWLVHWSHVKQNIMGIQMAVVLVPQS